VTFLFVGLSIMSAPIWLKRKIAKSVCAITNRRALMIEGSIFGSSTKVSSFKGEQLREMERVQHTDGLGDIVFEKRLTNFQTNARPHFQSVGFLGFERVRDVEMTLREALRIDERQPDTGYGVQA